MHVPNRRGRPLAKILSLVVLTSLAALTSACGAVSDSTGDGKAKEAKADPTAEVKIAAFIAATNNTYFQAELDGIEKAADAAKGNVTVTAFDGKFDGSVQTRQMEDALATGKYNAFLILPNDGAQAVAPVKKALADGIQVVAAYSPIGTDATTGAVQVPGLTATVWHDEPDDGTVLGEAAVAACEKEHPDAKPCNVALINGGNAVDAEVAKSDAFKAALKGHDIKLVADQPGDFLRDAARAASQNVLQANPDIHVLATTGDQMTQGAEDAVKSAGKLGKISLLGDGTTQYAIDAVDEGRWFSTNVYIPFTEGKIAAEVLIGAVRGVKPDKTEVNVRDLSPVGKVYTRDSETSMKAEWTP
jgi:ribose transport system substrate-binding protein